MNLPFKKFSKPPRFPEPPSATEFMNDRNHHFKSRVLGYLESRAHVALGARPGASLEELTEALIEIAYSEGNIVSSYELHTGGGRPGPGEITDHEVDRLASLAAAFARHEHSAEVMAEYRRRGSTGGRRSRRGKSFTMAMFDAVADLPEAEAARTLGCSRSTISRLRATQRSQKPSGRDDG